MVQIVHNVTHINDIPTKHHNSCQLSLLTCHPLILVAFCMNPHDIHHVHQRVEWGNKLSYGTPWCSIMLMVCMQDRVVFMVFTWQSTSMTFTVCRMGHGIPWDMPCKGKGVDIAPLRSEVSKDTIFNVHLKASS